jgi:glycosyltransferase involved in cell wall biosynthesis
MNKLPISALLHNTGSDNIGILPTVLANVWFCDHKLFISDNSTKEALDLAEKFGFDIHHYKGEDSMSDRRNFGISKAKHDLMLQVDSDEVYEPDAYLKLREIINMEKIEEFDCMLVNLFNYDTDRGVLMTTTPLERIYRKGARFEKKIQNELIHGGRALKTDIRLNHFGYSSKTHPLKQWYRIPLNEQQVRANPDDMHTRMYLINALVVAGANNTFMFERVLAHTEICIEQYKRDKTERHKYILQKVLRFFFIMASSVGNLTGFLTLAKPIISAMTFHPDSHAFMYEAHLATGDYEKALKWGKSFIECLDNFPKTNLVLEITTAHERPKVLRGIKELEAMNENSVPSE